MLDSCEQRSSDCVPQWFVMLTHLYIAVFKCFGYFIKWIYQLYWWLKGNNMNHTRRWLWPKVWEWIKVRVYRACLRTTSFSLYITMKGARIISTEYMLYMGTVEIITACTCGIFPSSRLKAPSQLQSVWLIYCKRVTWLWALTSAWCLSNISTTVVWPFWLAWSRGVAPFCREKIITHDIDSDWVNKKHCGTNLVHRTLLW